MSQTAHDKILETFRRAGNVLLARRIRGLWTRNAELADARTRVAISPHSLHDHPTNPTDDGIEFALVVLETLVADGTVLIPHKYIPDGRGLTIFYCTLPSDVAYTRLCDALTFASAQVVSSAELQAASPVRGTLRSIRVAPQILSTPFLQRSLTLSDSNSMSTFHSLGVEDSQQCGGPGYDGAILAGCAQAAAIDVNVSVEMLAMGLYDFVVLLLDTLHLQACRTRRSGLEDEVWAQFLDHSLRRQTSALFVEENPELPSMRLLEHFATVALLAHEPYDAFPTTLDALHAKNPVIYTLVQGRAALLANRIEAQFLLVPPDQPPPANPFERITQRRAFATQAHRNVLDNARAAAQIESPWQALARLPGPSPEYWRPHEKGYIITFWTMSQVGVCTGIHMTPQGLQAQVSADQLLTHVLPRFQAWLALDECALWWQRTRFQALPPALGHFLEQEGGLVRWLHRALQTMGPESSGAARVILRNLPDDVHAYYWPFSTLHDSVLHPRKRPRAAQEGDAFNRSRLVQDDNYQVLGRELVPDIENLTALLPPCLKAVVQKAKRPNDHIQHLDRRAMAFFLKAAGYSGTDTKHYLHTETPLYVGTPPVPNGLKTATGCKGIRTIAAANARDAQYACRCPFAGDSRPESACRQAAGLAPRGPFRFNPLQFVEEKLLATRT